MSEENNMSLSVEQLRRAQQQDKREQERSAHTIRELQSILADRMNVREYLTLCKQLSLNPMDAEPESEAEDLHTFLAKMPKVS